MEPMIITEREALLSLIVPTLELSQLLRKRKFEMDYLGSRFQ